ncbi:hypothetical protein AB0N07_44040 [Streptomyces sp. NPDC051172]|uniref:hypothetical protein n=1 Tax=Streptomyces sp. NPDC051172 TaxID=3155796 RepID=UPI0034402E1F
MGGISAFRLLLAVWVVTAALLVAVIAGAVVGPCDAGDRNWRGRLRIGAAAFGLAVASAVALLGVTGLIGQNA